MDIITDSKALKERLKPLFDEEFVTVDTEFMREKTYYPILCLIQIAGSKDAFAIDPMADKIDLEPFHKLMQDKNVLKVFHACEQDMEILLQIGGKLPRPISDTQVAAQVPVGGVVLDAPYTSIVDVAALEYPFLPVRPFMLDRYETIRYLPKVKVPLLVLHGEDDRVIPVEMGKAVYAAANAPKEIATFPRAGHSDHHLFGSYDEVFRWVDALESKAHMREYDPRIEGAAQ